MYAKNYVLKKICIQKNIFWKKYVPMQKIIFWKKYVLKKLFFEKDIILKKYVLKKICSQKNIFLKKKNNCYCLYI